MASVQNVREESDNACCLPGEGAPTLEPGGRIREKGGIEKMKKIVHTAKEMLVLSLPLLFCVLMVAYWLVFGYVL